MSKKTAMIFLAMFACWVLLPDLAAAQSRPRKKIIEYGWDVPYPDFVQQNIREMERRPFDGIIFRTRGFDHVFDTRDWNHEELQPQLDTLAEIKWEKFTDNFLTLYAANNSNLNWNRPFPFAGRAAPVL